MRGVEIRIKYPKWTMTLKGGDVLEAPSGMLRIVRKVSIGKVPTKTWVYFAIQRCSWTHRCHTCYTTAELYRMGYRKLEGTMPLRTKFDKLIYDDIGQPKGKTQLTCCDVIGIA